MTESATQQAPTRQPGKTETRHALLAAAADVIASNGYEKATLSEIARRAGLTTGAVYSTYGSKWELLQAVIRDLASTTSAALAERVGDSKITPDLQLEDLIKRSGAQLHDAVDHADLHKLGALQFEAILLALRNPDLLAAVSDSVRDRYTSGEKNLTQVAEASGHTYPLPPAQTAVLAEVLAQGLQLAQLINPTLVSEQLYRDAFRLITGLPVANAIPKTVRPARHPK